jgi:hypothetical protein
MSKPKMYQPHIGFCQSQNNHLSQKPECMTFYQALQKDFHLNLSMVVNGNKLFTMSSATMETITTNTSVENAGIHYANLQDEPQDDMFILPDSDSHHHDDVNDNNASLMDFEYTNFAHLQLLDNLESLSKPCQAVYTNARCIEVTLLQILKELEAPLWAFKDIMDWACNAYQSGYIFMPQQTSYKAQLQTLTRWVSMEHMHPTMVEVPLPSLIPDDSITVTTFDFVSQLHSLLSDQEFNTRENLVINPDNPFTKYVAPSSVLKEALRGSWYIQAWDYMDSSTNSNFMIPIILYIDKTQ